MGRACEQPLERSTAKQGEGWSAGACVPPGATHALNEPAMDSEIAQVKQNKSTSALHAPR